MEVVVGKDMLISGKKLGEVAHWKSLVLTLLWFAAKLMFLRQPYV